MFVSVNFICKKDGMSKEDFRAYLLNEHAPLVEKVPEMVGYVQNHVLWAQAFNIANGGQQVDAFEMLYFEDLDAMDRAFASEEYKAAVADEANFTSSVKLATAETVNVIPKPAGKPLVKRMSMCTTNPKMDFVHFRYEWFVIHANYVRNMEYVRAYNQNLILERYYPRGRQVTKDVVPLDSLVELWFDDEESIPKAFSTPNGRISNLHAQYINESVSPFLVEEHVIK